MPQAIRVSVDLASSLKAHMLAPRHYLYEDPASSIRVNPGRYDDLGEDIMSLISLSAQNLLSQNFDRQTGNSGLAASSGIGYYMSVPLRAGQVITNVITAITGAGVAITVGEVAIYDRDGDQLAISANITTAWESTGIKVNALGSPFTILETDIYYVAVLAVATTQPSMLRTVTGTAIPAGAVPGGLQPYGAESGLATLPATATIGVASAIPFWVGVN